MHLLDMCLIKLVSAVRFGLSFSHDSFDFCMSYVYAFFMHMFFPFLFYSESMLCFLLFSSLSLSLSLSYRTSLCTPSIYRALVVSVLGRCLEMSLSLTFVGNLFFGVVF